VGADPSGAASGDASVAPSEVARRLRDDLVFVLVGPQHPGNVGATARAMANMGLRRLVVVDPAPSFDLERTRWMAPGADAVVDGMRIVGTLDEALVGVHRAIATTARHRKHQQHVHEPADVAAQHLAGAPGHVTAVLFGREDTGLTREESLRCESLLRIPTDRHASLNLAQAVLLVAWHFFDASRHAGHRVGGRLLGGRSRPRSTEAVARSAGDDRLADLLALEPAVVELTGLLQRVGYTRGTSPERVAVTLREALQRAGVSDRQVRAVRGMVKRVGYALAHPEVDWRLSKRQKRLVQGVTPHEE
jgi:tRNA (cytidine32/uridine32-2'-O)-methyltransferase